MTTTPQTWYELWIIVRTAPDRVQTDSHELGLHYKSAAALSPHPDTEVEERNRDYARTAFQMSYVFASLGKDFEWSATCITGCSRTDTQLSHDDALRPVRDGYRFWEANRELVEWPDTIAVFESMFDIHLH